MRKITLQELKWKHVFLFIIGIIVLYLATMFICIMTDLTPLNESSLNVRL